MKRLSLRSISAPRSIPGAPATWLRRPSSAYSGMKRMPGRSSRSEALTLARSLPMHETIPRPVTTTRRPRPPSPRWSEAGAISEPFGGGEQSDPQVGRGVDLARVRDRAAVADHQCQLAAHHPSDVDLIRDQFGVRQYLSGELDLPHAQGAPATGLAEPGKIEAAQLPHRVHAQAAGHDRVALEVALEEPQVGADLEFGTDHALAVLATLGRDLGDPVEHQHRGGGQPGVARAEHLAAGTGQQLVAIKGGRSGHQHGNRTGEPVILPVFTTGGG